MAYVYSANVLYEDELLHKPYIRHALAYQGGCVCVELRSNVLP